MAYQILFTPDAHATLSALDDDRAASLGAQVEQFARLAAQSPIWNVTWLKLACDRAPVMRLVLDGIRCLFSLDEEGKQITVLALLPLPQGEEPSWRSAFN